MNDLRIPRPGRSDVRGWQRMPHASGGVEWDMWVRGARNTHLWSVRASPLELEYREALAHRLREARRRLRVHVAADRDVAKLIRDVCSQNFTDRT